MNRNSYGWMLTTNRHVPTSIKGDVLGIDGVGKIYVGFTRKIELRKRDSERVSCWADERWGWALYGLQRWAGFIRSLLSKWKDPLPNDSQSRKLVEELSSLITSLQEDVILSPLGPCPGTVVELGTEEVLGIDESGNVYMGFDDESFFPLRTREGQQHLPERAWVPEELLEWGTTALSYWIAFAAPAVRDTDNRDVFSREFLDDLSKLLTVLSKSRVEEDNLEGRGSPSIAPPLSLDLPPGDR